MASFFETIFCCAKCKKRYYRLVDAIYPRPPAEKLDTESMKKLTFYAITHPENLNKIGEYLLERLSRDLYQQRYKKVKVNFPKFFRYFNLNISGCCRCYECFASGLSHFSKFKSFS